MMRFGNGVTFIQRSVYMTKTIGTAQRLAKLARRYGLEVAIFEAAQADMS
jgi:hypothetical protein